MNVRFRDLKFFKFRNCDIEIFVAFIYNLKTFKFTKAK